jgi:hypothetical protein
MSDDRTEFPGEAVQGGGAFDWDAALHNAFADLMFSHEHGLQSNAGTPADTVHAAFEALMFAAAGDSGGPGGAATAWVANDDGAPLGFGRIMFRREAEANASHQLSGILDASSPQINANLVIASGRAANDNPVWVGSDADHLGGVYGRDPSVAVLDNGDALIAWIGADDIVHAQFLQVDHDAAGSADSAARAKLDQLLMGLGDAAAASGGKAGRVVVTPVSQNSFAAVWTSDFAMQSVLMGTILTLGTAAHAEDKDNAADTLTWSVSDISPVAVSSGVNAIAVTVTDAGALTVTYSTEDGARAGASTSSVVHFDTAATVETAIFTGDASSALSGHGHAGGGLAPVHHGHADVSNTVHAADAAGAVGHAANADNHHSVTTGADAAHHFEPSIAVDEQGRSYLGHFVEPATPGDPPVYQIESPGKEPIKVDWLKPVDPAHPEHNVDPQIAGTHSGVAVAGVSIKGSGTAQEESVKVEAFDHNGKPVGGGPVTVATATGAEHSFSDIATGYTHRGPAHATLTDTGSATAAGSGTGAVDHTTNTVASSTDAPAAAPEASPPEGVLAVAFIADANAEGFGTLKGQLFSVPDDAGPSDHLTALGADGNVGGDSDAVFQMGSPDDGGCRAPVIEGLEQGSLAIAWVQQTEHGDGPDVVRGEILTPGDGEAPEVIDLSAFMPEGVASGSDPVLASDDAGDLVVGWIQAVLSGGFESAAAIYRRVNDSDGHGHGHWRAPDQATILQKFDDIPHDFAIAVSGSGDNLSLTVAWRDADNTISTAHYDVDASQHGQTVTVQTDNSGHGSSHGEGDAAGLALAALPDGQILLVVGSSGEDGTNIITAVLPVPQADSSSDAGSGPDAAVSGTSVPDTAVPDTAVPDTPVLVPVVETAPAPAVISANDDGNDRHGGSDISGGSSDNSGSDCNAAPITVEPSAVDTSAPVDVPKAPVGSLMAALARLASDMPNDFGSIFIDNTVYNSGGSNDSGTNSSVASIIAANTDSGSNSGNGSNNDSGGSSRGSDISGHGSNDSSGKSGDSHSGSDNSGSSNSGSGSADSSGHEASVTDAPAAVQDTPAISLAFAIINLNSDLIQFVLHDVSVAQSTTDAGSNNASADTVAADAAPAPTVQDVAALELMATPEADRDGKNGSSDDTDHSGSGDGGNGTPATEQFAKLNNEDQGRGHDSSGGGIDGDKGNNDGNHDANDDGDGHDGDSVSHDGASANDNAPDDHHDAALTFAAGFGNDVGDYISPEEQAALIPEPISVLFEALQFANAFNDAANSDVMLFDTSNVVTISQFNSSGHGGYSHDTPFG